jgi:hypothetical protein
MAVRSPHEKREDSAARLVALDARREEVIAALKPYKKPVAKPTTGQAMTMTMTYV